MGVWSLVGLTYSGNHGFWVDAAEDFLDMRWRCKSMKGQRPLYDWSINFTMHIAAVDSGHSYRSLCIDIAYMVFWYTHANVESRLQLHS